MKFFNKYNEYITYIFWGGITTLVNIVSYWFSYDILHFSNIISTLIAWGIAVTVAFISNKLFVFKNHETSWTTNLKELFLFVGFRFISEGFELILMYLAVDLMNMNGLTWKVATNIIIMVLNYIFSKFLVFS